MSASDLISNPAHLSNVLNMLNANNTESIKEGEKRLKAAQKQPMFLISLLNQLKESPVPEIRHHAALILKKSLAKNYKKIGSANQSMLKADLLNVMKRETVKSVAVSIAGCVAKLAEAIFSIGPDWPDLFAVIVELSQSPNDAHRELNFSLLEQLIELIAESLKPHTTTLVQMLARGFDDNNVHVATAAMQATASFINALADTNEVLQLKPLLTPILNLVTKCIQNGEEVAAAEGLGVFEECVTMKQPLINDHIELIVPFVAGIIQNESFEPQLKRAAGNCLMTLVEYRPKLVAKKQMVAPTLTALASIIAQSDGPTAGTLFMSEGVQGHDDDTDEDEDEEEEDMQKMAHVIIDTMAVSIPSKYFIEPALSISAQGMQSPDYKMRKAGCTILGIIAEGCADAIRQVLPSIVPHLVAAAADVDQGVKETALFALGQFAEHCQPEILHYHSTILPALFNALDDSQHTVQTTACYVIEMFCENLQSETLRPILQPMLTKLAILFQSERENTQIMALSAISASALAADKDFIPYLDDVFKLLQPKLFQTEPSQLTMRGRSLECLGQIAVSVGAPHFTPYFEIGMQSAQQGILMDNDDLKEYAYVYFANSSKAMGKLFTPVLPQLVPHLLSVIGETELIFEGEDDDDEKEENDEDPAEEEDDEEDANYPRINGREGYVNTKRTAITAIGSIARYTLADFYPYLNATLEAIFDDKNGPTMSYHDSIKTEAFESIQFFVASACAHHGITGTPAKGVTITLPPDLHHIVTKSMNTCVDALLEDESKGVVAFAFQSITGIIVSVGLAALSVSCKDGSMIGQKLLQAVLTTLAQKLPCQVNELDEEEEHGHGDKDDDHDSLVMDDVTDLIGVLAKVMGPSFAAHFDVLLPSLMKFVEADRIHSDRSMAIGCFAEVVAELGPVSEKYVGVALPMVSAGLADDMESVRRNSAYFLAALIDSTGKLLGPHFLQILQMLYPLCSRKDTQQSFDCGGADIDNALSAVAKMIKVAPELIPLTQVLPVMLAALPLRADNSEGPSVYGTLANLIMTSNSYGAENFPLILIAFGQVLAPDSKAVDETKAIVITCLKALAADSARSGTLASAVNSLSASHPSLCSYITSAINS